MPKPTGIAVAITGHQSISGHDYSVACSTTVFQVMTNNTRLDRQAVSIYNDSTATVYVGLWYNTTLTHWSVKLLPGDYFETPNHYQGPITAVADADNGFLRVTEYR